MRYVLFRKGLVIGIICLLMLMSPIIPALNVFKQNLKEEVESNQNYGKPDLKITHIRHDYDEYDAYGWFNIYVINNGDGEVPGGPRKEVVSVYLHYVFHPLSYGHYRKTNSHSYKPPQLPGEEDKYTVIDFGHGNPGALVLIAFWINPTKLIDESNYENNGIWGLYETHLKDLKGWVYFTQVSDLHQWKTDGNPPWWWFPIENIEENQFSQTTQHQTSQTSNFNEGIGGITNE